MRQLLYVSNTALEIGLNDLDRILTTSRRNNAMMGITGLLLFIDGGFLQILEGEERAVRELYTRIACDPRHRNPRLMLDREIPARAFPDWSMGFERPCMDDPETAGMFGVAREAIHGRLSPGTGRIVAMMLQTFYAVQHSDLPLNLYYAG
ncbi:MAG TPA: BLUF domain-containing protein [Rhizomicrobium sp.]|nr:BLUF domain-containing protein [Rhizomicrobium sp.]